MPTLSLLLDEQLPAASRAMLEKVRSAQGRVPNMLQLLGHSPAVLAGYLQLAELLAAGTLSAVERERIALAASDANGCDYCLRAHAWLARRQGVSPEQQRLARQGGDSDPLARFARALIDGRGRVGAQVFAEARQAGLDEARMIEVVGQVALMTLSNYLNNLAQTEIDFPV